MPDLTKHHLRAKAAFDKGNFELAIEVLGECIDVDPAQPETYKLALAVGRKRAASGAKSGMFSGLGGFMTTDPHKQFSAAMKKVMTNPEAKVIVDAADAAQKMAAAGNKPMGEIAILLYEEFRASGLFNDKVLWNLGNLYMDKAKASGNKDHASLEKAIKAMNELAHKMPMHAEASRTAKNWEALKSMVIRSSQGSATDFRTQLASDDKARKAEVMNKLIRTPEDAKEVLRFLDEDLAAAPNDKQLVVKKGDILRRIDDLEGAKAAYARALEIDPHDFTVVIRLGDCRIADAQTAVKAATAGTPEHLEARKALVTIEIEEYRKRVERQPTDMGHRYNLGLRLMQTGQVDAAAAEFQKSVNDPRLRQNSHRYLGMCFAKRGLGDLAAQNYASYLSMVQDDLADEAKDVRYGLARLLEDGGKKADAIVHYEKLVGIDLSYKDAATRLAALRG